MHTNKDSLFNKELLSFPGWRRVRD